MRLGLITPGFSASEEDWCIPAVLDLVRVLATEHDVTVFALRYPHTRVPYEVHGARVVPFGAAEQRGPGRAFMMLRARRAIIRAAQHQPFDVLHALWAHEPGYLATTVGRCLDTPTVVSVLGGELVDLPAINYGGARGRVNRYLIRQALTRATRVTVPAPSIATMAAPLVEATRLDQVKLGVDTTRFRPGLALGTAGVQLDGSPALLQIGSLVPVKDHATMLAAFAHLAVDLPAACLHLVGDGPLRPQLESQAAALGIADTVRFHGAVDHGRLPDLYRQADLVTISSSFESQCMALLEAAACGRTLAGTTVGLLPSLVPVNHHAPPGDSAGLAEALRNALDDHVGTSEAEANARARDIASRYDVERTVERLVAVYHAARDS